MNRQKIDRIKERIEFINKDNEALKTQFTDSDGDIKAQAAEYISDNEEQVRFLQTLLDEPLDAPTHSGWWWNSHDQEGIFLILSDIAGTNHWRGVRYDTRRNTAFHGTPIITQGITGKWLPANNPFGKGEE